MAKPRQILDRRQTVGNIAKISRTMEMISTSRYRQFLNRCQDLREYTAAASRMVAHVRADAKLEATLPLLETHEQAHRDVLIVMASNRGLCGGYNMNILRMALGRYRELTAQGRAVDVYAVGKKTQRFLRFNGIEPCWEIDQYERRVDIDQVDKLAVALMDEFTAGRLRSVQVAHATFVSTSVQKPVLVTMLPVGDLDALAGKPERPRHRKLGAGDYQYMPDPDEILRILLPRTVSLRLYQAFLDSVLSEQVARMTAMHLASDNAGEMIRDLTMEYNRARQTLITTELAEIVTGVEAMK